MCSSLELLCDVDYIQKIEQRYVVVSHKLPFSNRFYMMRQCALKPVFSFSPRTHVNCDLAIQ